MSHIKLSDIQTDYIIPFRKPEPMVLLINKKTSFSLLNFAIPVDHRENKI